MCNPSCTVHSTEILISSFILPSKHSQPNICPTETASCVYTVNRIFQNKTFPFVVTFLLRDKLYFSQTHQFLMSQIINHKSLFSFYCDLATRLQQILKLRFQRVCFEMVFWLCWDFLFIVFSSQKLRILYLLNAFFSLHLLAVPFIILLATAMTFSKE